MTTPPIDSDRKVTMKRVTLALVATIALAASLGTGPARSFAAEQQALVDHATATVKSLIGNPDWREFNAMFAKARGVVVIPVFLKAGLLVGGAGGRGLVVARDNSAAGWSYPAFVTLFAASFGLQAGAESSEVVLLVMNDRSLRALTTGGVKVGGEAGLAIGIVGRGVAAATTGALSKDIYSFATSVGLFGGIAVEGAVIDNNDDWNRAYYGRAVDAPALLFEGAGANPAADALRSALAAGE